MNKQNQQGFVILVFLFFIVVNALIGGLCTEYVIEYWGSFASDKPVNIPFVIAGVIGLFFGEFFIPAALVTWLLSFVLVCSACI